MDELDNEHHGVELNAKLRGELRKSSLAKRDGIPTDERLRVSAKITCELRAYLDSHNARFVHCYISFRSEVATRDFIDEMLERGLRVVVPVVEDLDGNEFLIHTEIAHLNNLRQGRFGLDEPVERSAAALTDLDAVVLPLAAFDRKGNRLGYGKGFYDRFLATLPREVKRIGLAFSVQEVDRIPVSDHDQKLDMVITERETIDCAAPKAILVSPKAGTSI